MRAFWGFGYCHAFVVVWVFWVLPGLGGFVLGCGFSGFEFGCLDSVGVSLFAYWFGFELGICELG